MGRTSAIGQHEGTCMALYEHVFLARQDLAQAQVDTLAETATKIVEERGGKVVKTETWGLRSLAYHVVLEASDRTLSEADCRKFLDRVERATAELGGQLRREPAQEASPPGQASPTRVG